MYSEFRNPRHLFYRKKKKNKKKRMNWRMEVRNYEQMRISISSHRQHLKFVWLTIIYRTYKAIILARASGHGLPRDPAGRLFRERFCSYKNTYRRVRCRDCIFLYISAHSVSPIIINFMTNAYLTYPHIFN